MNIIEKYKNYFIERDYQKNITIFKENEECYNVGYIISGTLKISTYTNSDKEEIINIITKENFFGDNLIFSNNNKYLGTGTSITQLKVLWVNQQTLLKLLKFDDFCAYYLNILSNKQINLRMKNLMLSHKNIRDRIMFYLIEQSKINNSNIYIYKSITELAKILGIPRPSLSRELTKLVNDNYILKDKNKIILKRG